MPSGRFVGISALMALVILAIAWGFWPRPVLVETSIVARRPLRITIEEEGKTRVKERYMLYAPVAGYLRRIDLEVGDVVELGQPLALIDPLPPTVLDPRSRAEAEARVAAARSALARVKASAGQARAEAEHASVEFRRREELISRSLISRSEFDQARSRMLALKAAAQAANSAIEVARFDLEAAQAALRYSAVADTSKPVETVQVRSPIGGRVLNIEQKSAGVVPAGHLLLEVGDTHNLEIEVEVLSHDAIRIEPGGRVLLERWGGNDILEGVVRIIKPTGFTKISALGVEEQRVVVIADIRSASEIWRRLGDGYRVEAKFIVWEQPDALTVASNALFRHNDGRAVFVVENGRARLRSVRTGQTNGLLTEILEGLVLGEEVIDHPDDTIDEGTRVASFGS